MTSVDLNKYNEIFYKNLSVENVRNGLIVPFQAFIRDFIANNTIFKSYNMYL